jgi:hypothetical protein
MPDAAESVARGVFIGLAGAAAVFADRLAGLRAVEFEQRVHGVLAVHETQPVEHQAGVGHVHACQTIGACWGVRQLPDRRELRSLCSSDASHRDAVSA